MPSPIPMSEWGAFSEWSMSQRPKLVAVAASDDGDNDDDPPPEPKKPILAKPKAKKKMKNKTKSRAPKLVNVAALERDIRELSAMYPEQASATLDPQQRHYLSASAAAFGMSLDDYMQAMENDERPAAHVSPQATYAAEADTSKLNWVMRGQTGQHPSLKATKREAREAMAKAHARDRAGMFGGSR